MVVGPVEPALAERDGAGGWLGGILAAEQQQADGDERIVLSVFPHLIEERRGSIAEWPGLALRARKLDRRREQHRLERLQTRGCRNGGDHRTRAVWAPAVQEVVVHLHHDPAPGRQGDAHPFGKPVTAPAWCPGGDPRRIVEAARGARGPSRRIDPRAAEAAPARPCGPPVERLGLGDALRRHAEQDHVMHETGRVRLDPDRRRERVLASFGSSMKQR